MKNSITLAVRHQRARADAPNVVTLEAPRLRVTADASNAVTMAVHMHAAPAPDHAYIQLDGHYLVFGGRKIYHDA